MGLSVERVLTESFEAESWYIASGTQGLLFSNDGLRLIFYFFTARLNLHPIHLCGENIEMSFLKMY